MINHTKLTEHGLREAIKNTPAFKNIGNTAFQNLYFKLKTFNIFYSNYGLACRYGLDYLKDKQNISSRDVAIITEIYNEVK